MVENSTQNPKTEGMKPAIVTRSEKNGKKVKWEFIRVSKIYHKTTENYDPESTLFLLYPQRLSSEDIFFSVDNL